MTNDEKLCPFSKPIIGQWCHCQYAKLSDPDRCAGKMHCQHPDNHLENCHELVVQLENNMRFVLGIRDKDKPLTHQQYMKIKCGAMKGMHRILNLGVEELPSIILISAHIIKRYGSFADFPYGQIVNDIAGFSHRKSVKKSNNV